jgi:hypothetical protein
VNATHKIVDRTHPRAPNLTLGEAFRIFRRVHTARIMSILLLGLVVLRLALWDFTVWDLALVAGLVAMHPFSEWLIHVFVLHFRPRQIGWHEIDMVAARYHRAHHVDPHDPRYWFIPIQSGLVGFVVISVIARLVMPTPALAVTVMVTAVGLGLFYEWIHYLTHTSYRPVGRWYKRLWKHHRLHHFKNEHYWMGVSMHLGDHVLRTHPDPATVETSPTCRDLMGETKPPASP